jgi:hypothetical protein
MHNPAKAYGIDSTFTTEKVIATANVVLIAILLILGQLDRLKSGTPEPEEYASAVESGR